MKPPHPRHNLNSIRPKHPAKQDNTIVLPGTDVATDLAAIAAGRARWDADSNRYEINGRSYGVEPTGTIMPVSGPGFRQLPRAGYKALKALILAEGDVSTAREALRRDPGIGETDWTMALEVFEHHKNFRGGA